MKIPHINYETIEVNTKKVFINDGNNAEFQQLLKTFDASDKGLIIIGPRESGKSRLADQLAFKHKKFPEVIYVDGRNYSVDSTFHFHSCTEDTKLIIADDFKSQEALKDFLFFTMDSIRADRLHKQSIIINPKKIIVCNGNIKSHHLPKGISMFKRFNVINLFTDASEKNDIETFSLYRLQWELPKMNAGDWFYLKGDDEKWELYDANKDYFFIKSTHTKQLIALKKLTQ